jgi:hypothetical protein
VVMTPLHRYTPGGEWEVVPHPMDSPAPDGSVAYYQDSLSPSVGEQVALFDDGIARALCRYLVALTVRKNVPLVDGPYLQLLEDDGAVPPGWIMLRAIVWCDEFDAITPMTAEAVGQDG